MSDQSQTFPEKAIAFHYYGYSSAFAVCIDTCDGPDGSTTRQEINTTAAFLSHNDITVMRIVDGTLCYTDFSTAALVILGMEQTLRNP
jgi:hypothetical protein